MSTTSRSRFYAVAYGRKPGVYASQWEARRIGVGNFSNPIIRVFHGRDEALLWLRQRNVRPAEVVPVRRKQRERPQRVEGGIGSAEHSALGTLHCVHLLDEDSDAYSVAIGDGAGALLAFEKVNHDVVPAVPEAVELHLAALAFRRLPPGPRNDSLRIVIASAYLHTELLPRRDTYKREQWRRPIAHRDLARRLSDLLDTRSGVTLEAPEQTGADESARAALCEAVARHMTSGHGKNFSH